jgi:prepilin-type N-terminal cleavage/methylation domain-containing protein
MIRRATGRRDRGFTLLESFMALAVLAIGMLGLLGLTSVGVRANYFGRRMAQAEELAHDLAEQVEHWDYSDARLSPGCGNLALANCALDTNTITQPTFTSSWNLGTGDATANIIQYGEGSDTNAVQKNALALGKTAYSGALSDPNPDVPGTLIFSRYWNVYTFNGGKLVQIFVRWKEPALESGPPGSSGWRMVAISTFKTPPYLFLGP